MRSHRESGVALLTALLMLLLMSSLLVGFILLLMGDLRLTGFDRDRSQAFYGAEAGMEKLTADLGGMFQATYSPSGTQINNLMNSPPVIPGLQYLGPNNSPGYRISFPPDVKGNPQASTRTILSGPFQGLVGQVTPYTLTITTRTLNGAEVRLQRTVQTVGIPIFQFGVFSQTDLSFFAGPNFNFGGRVHTNGNLFLAEGSGSTLTMADRVTAVGEVIRTNLSNGWSTSANYTGTVAITTGPGTYAPLASNQGSLQGTLGTPWNEPTWTNASLGTYNGNIRNGRTGAKSLTLPLGMQPIDLLRRPVQNEDSTKPAVLRGRYHAMASLRILLSDDPNDIQKLPCIDATSQPVDLTTLAVPVASLPPWYTAGIPLAASGAASSTIYNPTDGYWIQSNKAIITGYIKIEIQTAFGNPCGSWKDVTKEILNLGIAGRNLNPVNSTSPYWLGASPTLPSLPGSQQPPSTCPDPSPNAVMRLERVRDNPSNGDGPNGACGVNFANVPPVPTAPTDYWPNVLFDPREGTQRDAAPGPPNNSSPTLGGAMHYVELDINNLARWFTGAIGTSGPQAKDLSVSSYNFAVYFSDRRGNYTASAIVGGWPPASPTGHETGEYGSEDFVNPADAFGCPNSVLDQGEDLDSLGGSPHTYGQKPVLPATLLATGAPALTPNPNCIVTSPSSTWPGTFYTQAQDARENPPLFFRRALKVVNGSNINPGACPNGVVCGLTIASENPAYVQGDFNANSASGGFNDPHVAAAVLADAFTFLSNNWNDVNSFSSPYSTGGRSGLTTWYRLGIVAGKGISFPQPTGYATPQDFGTDGGVHNFLRYVEMWSGQTLNYRGSIASLFYNRQAVGIYKCCNTVYSPPSRAYNFDVEFLQPSLLPPRTPTFRDINTTGFTQLIRPSQ